MRIGGIEVRPLLLKIVQRRQRIGRTFGGKLGLRLAEGISGIVAHRQAQDVTVMLLGLAEAADLRAFPGQRRTVGRAVRGAGREPRRLALGAEDKRRAGQDPAQCELDAGVEAAARAFLLIERHQLGDLGPGNGAAIRAPGKRQHDARRARGFGGRRGIRPSAREWCTSSRRAQ